MPYMPRQNLEHDLDVFGVIRAHIVDTIPILATEGLPQLTVIGAIGDEPTYRIGDVGFGTSTVTDRDIVTLGDELVNESEAVELCATHDENFHGERQYLTYSVLRPTVPPMSRVTVSEIESVANAALVAAGAAPNVANHVAHATAVAESNGNRICGLYYLESYCTQLVTNRVDGSVEPSVTTPRPGTVIVDARLGFAQPAFAAGFDHAVAAARANGICSFSVAHSHTATSLGYFTEQLALAGMIAIGATNASPRVAPPGGSRALLGTNPIAMAVPDGSGGIAFQFDFATSAVALGTITMAAARGETIPEGWAVDADGTPTTDPAAAVAGSMLSAGGHKGYGIGLLVEILAGALTGSNLSADIPALKTPEGPPHNIGQHYLVIDPTAHADGVFIERLQQLAELVTEQPGARLPGAGREPATEVDVDDVLWTRCQELANS